MYLPAGVNSAQDIQRTLFPALHFLQLSLRKSLLEFGSHQRGTQIYLCVNYHCDTQSFVWRLYFAFSDEQIYIWQPSTVINRKAQFIQTGVPSFREKNELLFLEKVVIEVGGIVSKKKMCGWIDTRTRAVEKKCWTWPWWFFRNCYFRHWRAKKLLKFSIKRLLFCWINIDFKPEGIIVILIIMHF